MQAGRELGRCKVTHSGELELKAQGGQGSWSLQGTELQTTLDISRGTHKFSANQRK